MQSRRSSDISRAGLVRMVSDLRAVLRQVLLDREGFRNDAEETLATTVFDVSPEDEHEPDRNAPPPCPIRHRLPDTRDSVNVVLKLNDVIDSQDVLVGVINDLRNALRQVLLDPARHREQAEQVLQETALERVNERRRKVVPYDVYLRVGLFPSGDPGEAFANVGKIGGREGKLLDAWCTSVSMLLQYGVPLDVIVAKFRGWPFEPSGFLRNQDEAVQVVFEGRGVRSPLDAIVKWLERRFSSKKES